MKPIFLRKESLLIKILFVLIFSFFSSGSLAQVLIGSKAGVNFSSLKVIYSEDYYNETQELKGQSNIFFGAFFNAYLTGGLSLQPEVVFSMTGGEDKTTWLDEYSNVREEGEYNEKFKFTYLDVPVLLQYELSKKISFQAGFQFSFLLSARSSGKVSFQIFENNQTTFTGGHSWDDENIKEYMRSPGLGFVAGVKYNVSERFHINARYNLGVSNLINSEDFYEDEDSKMRLNIAQISLEYVVFK